MPWAVDDVDEYKKGLSEKEKKQWVAIANSALSSCLKKGGKESACAASAIRQANGAVKTNSVFSAHAMQTNNYNLRTEMYEGKEHLVVPVVMMVEGVHNGSHGPILHTIDELGKFVGAWNGIPVPVLHPQENGTFISANSPKILQKQRVGWVFGAHVDGKKLKAEAWLEKDKLGKVSPKTLAMIQNMQPMDVSVGVFTEDDETPGEWNGVKYTAIARNHRPDHLALLPGETGACSWEKGCGVRVNAEGGEVDVKMDLGELRTSLLEQGLAIIQVNADPAFEDIARGIDAILNTLSTPTRSYYLNEVHDKYFIFEIGARPLGEEGKTTYTLYKHAYTLDANGKPVLEGEPEEVVRKVQYVKALMEGGTRMERKDGKDIKTNESKPCCPEKVELLVNSKHSPFGEENREWLNSLTQEQIDKIVVPVANLEAEEQVEVKEEEKKVEEMTEEKKVEANASQEDMIKAFQERIKTPEDFLKIAPADMRDLFANGLKLHQEQRKVLIEKVAAYSDAFTREELEGKSMEELNKLAKLIPTPVDYSGLGVGGVKANTSKVAPMLPIGVTEKKEG